MLLYGIAAVIGNIHTSGIEIRNCITSFCNSISFLGAKHDVGREVVFQCRDEGPARATVRWTRGSGLALPPSSRDFNGRLEMPNIQVRLFIYLFVLKTN